MDIYATHLPVLDAIGKILPVEFILEFGAGTYSTFTFGEMAMQVDSYETDRGWFEALITQVPPNCMLYYSPDPLATLVPLLNLDKYDLIFVDDGSSVEERVRTIRAIAERTPVPPVVIHDFENPAYREASVWWERRLVYTRLSPYTAILWNDEAILPDEEQQFITLLGMISE